MDTYPERGQKQLEDILDTLEALRRGAPSPRLTFARLYSLAFFALALVAAPADWGLARGAAAAAVGISALKLLERFGPGPRSWWARLSDQLWSYEPRDRQALERLRKDLVANANQGQRKAIAQVWSWARTELATIAGGARRGE